MKRLVILGGGTAGTMVANKLRAALGKHELQITVVDRDDAPPLPARLPVHAVRHLQHQRRSSGRGTGSSPTASTWC